MSIARTALEARREVSVGSDKMNFIIRGFKHAMGFRVFTFEGIAADGTRAVFTVKTDLSLTREHGIRLQELPLLCREVLERCDEAESTRAFTYTEEDMRLHAADCAARDGAARKRKKPRPPVSEQAGAAWRVPPR